MEAGLAVSKEVGEDVEALLLDIAIKLFIREQTKLKILGFDMLNDAWASL